MLAALLHILGLKTLYYETINTRSFYFIFDWVCADRLIKNHDTEHQKYGLRPLHYGNSPAIGAVEF